MRPQNVHLTTTRVLLAIAVLIFLTIATSQAATAQSALAAYAYVGTEVSGSETGYVTEYSIFATGATLSPTGSSVSGASGSLVVNSRFVFATDGKYIVTYTRGANGHLQQTSSVDGTAHNITPQGSLVGPLTLDRTGQTLYASEFEYDGTDNDAYSVWTINSDGSLSFVMNVGSDVDYNTYLVFSQDNHYAYGFGCYFASWDIFGLKRNSDGTLTSFNPMAAQPPSSDTLCPGGLANSAMNFVAVAYIDIEVNNPQYQLASYTLNSDGTLGLVQNSEVTTPFNNERVPAMTFDPSGTYLAMAGSAGIQMYKLQAGGLLVPIGSVVDSNVQFTELRWDNSNHLYAISSAGFYVFTSNAGVLTQDRGYPLPESQAASLAVLPAQ